MAATIVSELLGLDNYNYWRRQVSLYLIFEGLWDTLDDKNQRPRGGPKLKAWERSDAKALHTILICCGNEALPFVENSTTAKQAWETLSEKLQNQDDQRHAHAARDVDVQPREVTEDNQISEVQNEDRQVEIETTQDDENNGNIVDNPDYQPFFKALVYPCDWKVVMEFINKYPEAVRLRAPSCGFPALHLAAICREVDVVNKLVESMTANDLEIITADVGTTALSCCRASVRGDSDEAVAIADCLVKKNVNLLRIASPLNGHFEVVNAFVNDMPKLFKYLYSATLKLEVFEDYNSQAALLICYSLRKQEYDIALDLIKKKPSLVLADNGLGMSPMNELACMPSVFLNWPKMSDDDKKVSPRTMVDDHTTFIDIPNPDNAQDHEQKNGTNHHLSQKHPKIRQILEYMGKETRRTGLDAKQYRFMQTSIFQATERGMVEFIRPLLRAHPNIRKLKDENGRSMFHLAVECRHEKIVSLLHGFSMFRKKVILSDMDDNHNKPLHMMGFVSPFTYANRIRGAALQMQRELQWFKELESMTDLDDREVVNYTDDMKPRELFNKNHMELVKEGEKSMKDTATSCTVVGAFIITIMFAAIFTIPGGNKGGTGTLALLDKKLLKIFIVAVAISLCSSTTSVMMFLGILTSRYAQDDFLVSLPRKMILGLSTLFLSIVAMMVAFSLAIFLMLPSHLWIGILTILLSCIPIITFGRMQLPFLIEIYVSTRRSSLFD